VASALIGVVLIAAGCNMIGQLPAPGASGQEVFARFLDDRDSLRTGALLLILGLALLVVFTAILRDHLDPDRDRVATSVLSFSGLLAIGGALFSAAAIAALAIGAENADPQSSRAILDVAQAVAAATGVLAAVALAAAAALAGGNERPRRTFLAVLALVAAFGCLLWLPSLITDADAFAPGSVLGFVVGLVLVLIWVVASAISLARGMPRTQ